MPEVSRAQLFVYAALAVAGLLLGARWINDDSGGGSAGSVAFGSHGESETDGDIKVSSGAAGLVVHVAGEVEKPGVYRLPVGSRVADAIERAGGSTRDAMADAINLAAPLADGQQVQVPGKAPAAAGMSATGAAQGPISLGQATAADLDTIEGIGPVTAAAILAFRDENGGLASIDELDQVSGIGPTTMEALRARLQP